MDPDLRRTPAALLSRRGTSWAMLSWAMPSWAGIALLLAACGNGSSGTAAPQLRVIDAAYAAANNFDVLVNAVSAATDLGYGGVTALQSANEGGNTVVFEPTGTTTKALTASFSAAKGSYYSVFALESGTSPSALIVAQSNAGVSAGQARLSFVSAYPGAAALDIYLTAPTANLPATPTIPALSYQGSNSSAVAPAVLGVTAGAYRIRAYAAGSTTTPVYDSGPVTAASGADLLLALEQTSGSAAPFTLLELGADNSVLHIPDQRVELRLGNFAPALGTVDSFLDPGNEGNSSANSFSAGLTARNVTTYQAELPGTYRLSLANSGSTLELLGASLALGTGTARSIFAIGLAGQASPYDLRLLALTDELSAPATGQAKLRIVHVSPDLGAVDVVLLDLSGTTPVIASRIAVDLTYSAASSYIQIPAGSYTVALVPTGLATPLLPSSSGSALGLSAGTVYTLLADGCRYPGSGVCGAAGATLQLALLTDR